MQKGAICLCRKNLFLASFFLGSGVGLLVSCLIAGFLAVLVGVVCIISGIVLLKN